MGAELLSVAEGGLCGEVLYCAIILWLFVTSWVIFTFVEDSNVDGKRRRKLAGAAAASGPVSQDR